MFSTVESPLLSKLHAILSALFLSTVSVINRRQICVGLFLDSLTSTDQLVYPSGNAGIRKGSGI